MRPALVKPIGIVAALCLAAPAPCRGDESLMENVKRLCEDYLEGFGSAQTDLVYHHRLNGPTGLDILESPEEIAKGRVRGKDMPYGYGSGIQDVALENGHLLIALCEAHEATGDEFFAQTARRILQGMKLVATVSPEPGFVPRGPHPDGKSYYRDSSLDQHTTFVYALWRYYRSPLATEADRAFIASELQEVAQRLERYEWGIRVEDGGQVAHVGFSWLQFTRVGATVLLAVLRSVHDVTDDDHWGALYGELGAENDGRRWELLSTTDEAEWAPFTLYSNQFAVGLAALADTEPDPERRRSLAAYRQSMAERMLHSNVFDESAWRRLDWAGNFPDKANRPDDWEEQETQKLLAPFGLSLSRPATVSDLLARFDPELLAARDWRVRKVNEKLCFGLPTAAFHAALLADDSALVREVAPHVRDMVEKMLVGGRLYTRGENYNRAVVLGLHLLALEHRA